MYKVEYAKGVVKDLRTLSKPLKKRALEIVETLLAEKPSLGKPLKGTYKGLWRYRIGDYRIIYSIEYQKLTILVLRIRHRKNVYEGIIF